MQKYLTQLHEDLIAARRSEKEIEIGFEGENAEEIEDQSTLASFEEAERYAAGEIPTKKFGDACGIQKMQFPPAEKLTEMQMNALCEGIQDLMWSWFIDISLPDTLPLDRRYHFLTEVFDTEVMLVENGHIGIELCEYDEKHCVFGDHCMCKEDAEDTSETEMDIDDDIDGNEELPFFEH